MAPCGLLLMLLCAVKASPLPTLHPPSSSEVESDDSRRVLGSSVVTSVSVIMDLGNGTKAYFADAAGRPVDKPTAASLISSPGGLLSPDRYEFYTFDEDGELVKRFMSLEQIQSLIAGGDGKPGSTNHLERLPVEDDNEGSASAMLGVRDVVASVQNVLRGELEANKNKVPMPVASPPSAPVSSDPSLDIAAASWGVILPAIMGASNDQSPASTEQTPVSPSIKVPTPDSAKNTSTVHVSSESPPQISTADKIQVSSSQAPPHKHDVTSVSSVIKPSQDMESEQSDIKPQGVMVPEIKPQGVKVPEIITETSISASYSSSESHETRPFLKRPPSLSQKNTTVPVFISHVSSEDTSSEQPDSSENSSSADDSQETGENSSLQESSQTDSSTNQQESEESELQSSQSVSSSASQQQTNGTLQDNTTYQDNPDLTDEELAIQTIIQELQSSDDSTLRTPADGTTTKPFIINQQQPSEQVPSNVTADLSQDEGLTKDLYNQTGIPVSEASSQVTQDASVSQHPHDDISSHSSNVANITHSSHPPDTTPPTTDYIIKLTELPPTTVSELKSSPEAEWITPDGNEPSDHHNVTHSSSTTAYDYDYPSSELPYSEDIYSSSVESHTKTSESPTSVSYPGSTEFISTPDEYTYSEASSSDHSWNEDLDTKGSDIKHHSSSDEHPSTALYDYDYYLGSSEQTCDYSAEDTNGNKTPHKPCGGHLVPHSTGESTTDSPKHPENDDVIHTVSPNKDSGEEEPEYNTDHPYTTEGPDDFKKTNPPPSEEPELESLDVKKQPHSELTPSTITTKTPNITLPLGLKPPFPDPLPENINSSSSDEPTSIDLFQEPSPDAEQENDDPVKSQIPNSTPTPVSDLEADDTKTHDIPTTSILQIIENLGGNVPLPTKDENITLNVEPSTETPDTKIDTPSKINQEDNEAGKPATPLQDEKETVPEPVTDKPVIKWYGITHYLEDSEESSETDELVGTTVRSELTSSITERLTTSPDKNPTDDQASLDDQVSLDLADSLSSVLSQVVEQVGMVTSPSTTDTRGESTTLIPDQKAENQENEQSTKISVNTKSDQILTTFIPDEDGKTTPTVSIPVTDSTHSVISDKNSNKYVEEIEKDIEQEDLGNNDDSVVKRQDEKLEEAPNKAHSPENLSASTPSTTTTQKFQQTNSPIVYEDAETFNAYGVLTQGTLQNEKTSPPLVKKVVSSNLGQNTDKIEEYLSELYSGNDKEGTDMVNDSHGDVETKIVKDSLLASKPISKKDNDYIPEETIPAVYHPTRDSTDAPVTEASTFISNIPEANDVSEETSATTMEPTPLNGISDNLPEIIFKNSQLPTTDRIDEFGITGEFNENDSTEGDALENSTITQENETTTDEIRTDIAGTTDSPPMTEPPVLTKEYSEKLDTVQPSEATTESSTILFRKGIVGNEDATQVVEEFVTTVDDISTPTVTETPFKTTNPVPSTAEEQENNESKDDIETAFPTLPTTADNEMSTVKYESIVETSTSEQQSDSVTTLETSTDVLPSTSDSDKPTGEATKLGTSVGTKISPSDPLLESSTVFDSTPIEIQSSTSDTLLETPATDETKLEEDSAKLDPQTGNKVSVSKPLLDTPSIELETPTEDEPTKLDTATTIKVSVSDSLPEAPSSDLQAPMEGEPSKLDTATATKVNGSNLILDAPSIELEISTKGDSTKLGSTTGIKVGVSKPFLETPSIELETPTEEAATELDTATVIKVSTSSPLLETPSTVNTTKLDTPEGGDSTKLGIPTAIKTSVSDPLLETLTGIKEGSNDIRPQPPISRPQFDSTYQPAPSPIELDPAPYENLGLEVTTVGLSTDVRKFAELCNELAFRLWSSIAIRSLNTARSVVMSPIGLTSILAMVFLGARGPTSGQMNDILGLDDMVTFNPHLVFRNVTESIVLNRTPGVATAAFVRELYSDRSKGKLLDFYKERAQQFYDGHVEEVNFNMISDVLRRRTNLLVKRQTRGKIPEYLRGTNIMLHAPLAAFSANIFQTDCSQASTDGRNGEMYFSVLPSTRQRRLVPVPAAVWRSGFLAGYEPSLDATAVALGGAESSPVSVILILPGQQGQLALGDSLAQLEKRLIDPPLKRGAWSRLLRCMLPRPGLEVQIPRFSHRSLLNMTGALQRMGLKDLFNAERADLRGLNGVANDLHLSDIVQVNTFSTCAEDSVSTRHHMEIYPTSPQQGRTGRDRDADFTNVPLALRPRQARVPDSPRLRFDRPFLYVVRHNPTGFLLHMGRFNPHLLH